MEMKFGIGRKEALKQPREGISRLGSLSGFFLRAILQSEP
jgi:hypothetical protein